MIIRNDLSGHVARRNFTANNRQMNKVLEKLSSGYRINRAGDDAAGLAISEKMRRLITGLGRARDNSREGIKLIQIGEGAVQEIHDMLKRSLYLAGESANGTYMDELDRENLQKELDQICSEIDRIAASANFNGIKLFQNIGIDYERSTSPDSTTARKFQDELEELIRQQIHDAISDAAQERSEDARELGEGEITLEELAESTDPDKVNIVYIQHDSVEATQTPDGSATGTHEVTENGQQRSLNEILQKEIVPNIIDRLLQNYSAFSYLRGSNIGIGLEYYHGNGTSQASTLAYVRVAASSSSAGISLSYTLGVNLDTLGDWENGGREELEATIAHEMIHAFMDEATTAGMIGWGGDATGTQLANKNGEKFPSWFVEGMAQTASGPGNWLKSFGLSENSSDSDIIKAISGNRLGVTASASEYGTGYLACMYLGWYIASKGDLSQINAATISNGLNMLLSKVIGGSSLNDAINELTGTYFSSVSDFQNRFSGVTDAEKLLDFTRGLLAATGEGRGGLIAGDLTATDPAPNGENTSIGGLFELNPDNTSVKNVYPDDYPVLSGGTVSKGGVSPSDYEPAQPQKDFGDFVVLGADLSGVSLDENGDLVVTGSGDVTIRMKSGASTHDIRLEGTGKVTLDGVNTTGKIDVSSQSAEITVNGVNKVGTIVANGVNVTLKGGRLETNSFISVPSVNLTLDGTTLTINNGDLYAGNLTIKNGTLDIGSGDINCSGSFKVEGAAVVVGNLSCSTSPTGHRETDLPWSDIAGLGALTSITIDGVTFDVSGMDAQNAKLWLDASKAHRVTFSNGSTSKTLSAKPVDNPVTRFEWGAPLRPYSVTKADGSVAVEGEDYKYADDGLTLILLKAGEFTIGTGSQVDEAGNPLMGRIKLNDGIGDVKLTLNGVTSEVTTGCAFDLGNNNNVTLKLANGTTNTFTSGNGYAGIHVGEHTHLSIGEEGVTSTGTLNATGGADGAGIGSNGTGGETPPNDDWKDWAPDNSITIWSGTINATGTTGTSKRGSGAGIGAGTNSSFGKITIHGGTITAQGGTGGAGIGGAGDDGSKFGTVGDILIDGGEIIAKSEAHGAGIGGGWGTGKNKYLCHNITIEGNAHIIEASSGTHGTGIGAGCLSEGGNIKISGNAVIDLAQGGSSGAGIGASSSGSCGNIEISGNATIKKAIGGDSSAGIGAGSGSDAGSITIDTTGTINATGGRNGVGIGSGYNNSSVGDIEIRKGTVNATGGSDGTGIGAGRNSTSGSISIGNNNGDKVNVNAKGGMTNDGGNILAYADKAHKTAQLIKIFGENTTVHAGDAGEGLYNTSGASDGDGNNMYSYPLYIYGDVDPDDELDASKDLHDPDYVAEKSKDNKSWGSLPLLPDGSKGTITSITATGADGTQITWVPNIEHDDSNGTRDNYVYLWMTGQDQDLTITFQDGSTVNLHLKFYDKAGKFRVEFVQDEPPAAEPPEYNVSDPIPARPSTSAKPPEIEKIPSPYDGGIILQIGAEYGEILKVPRFYLSSAALGLDEISIATQDKALQSIEVLRKAVNRVSDIRGEYGALQNRLEHNINDLSQAYENITDAESRIRDADMAEEYTRMVKLNILQQAAQAVMAHNNENTGRVLQLLQ